ncbi:hypothetical protein [Hymenobacter mucosus]|uniref:Uncharacterized protein n=1 Tax=Hymenobacter mucosus TaxID=1411120 RepID=A0A238ZV17_9BACT|nr:hypothetical protein [Hymenobacter mucosus]SNR87286.1 hypothetical protein SAMN06269173_1109 [Hymenobacter mucosus]
MTIITVLRALYHGQALRGLSSKAVGLLASGTTLMVLGGIRPLLLQPHHWFAGIVYTLGLLSEVGLLLLAGLLWRLYRQRIGIE